MTEQEFHCEKCGKNHATNEHRIYEKLCLVEAGVPIERLFVMPGEEAGDPKVDEKLREIEEWLEGK